MHPYWYSIDDIYQSTQTKPFDIAWCSFKILLWVQLCFSSKWDLWRTNKSFVLRKMLHLPVIWGYLANLFIYQTNKCAEDLIWKKPMFCFSRVSACPSHCFVCLLFHLFWSNKESETLWQTWDPPKRKTICQKKDMIFDSLGETVTEHIWYEFFEVIDSPNFHLLFPGNILNKRMCLFFPKIPSNSTFERYAAFDKRDLLLNGIEQAINSSNKHTKVGGQWLLLVPLIGGRYHIIHQLAVYKPLPLIYHL